MTNRHRPSKKVATLGLIVAMAIVGGTGFVASGTTISFFAAEPETATVTAPAQVVNDSTASSSKAVQFKVASTGGGVCNNPFANTSVARGDINIPGGKYQVRNEAWGDQIGPQTIYACSEQSWYVMSQQPSGGDGTAVQSYPDSLYDFSSSNKTVAQYNSITSTFAEQYTTQGNWDAGYDTWLNNWGKEVMFWNEWTGGQGYWATQAKTAVTLNGVPYHFINNGGEMIFVRDTQVKSGSVDILAGYKWLVTQGLLSNSDVPTQIEYGVEICSTVGNQRFDTTGFTVNLN